MNTYAWQKRTPINTSLMLTARRYHAQPNACPDCGPQLWISDRRGDKVKDKNSKTAEAAKIIYLLEKEQRLKKVEGRTDLAVSPAGQLCGWPGPV